MASRVPSGNHDGVSIDEFLPVALAARAAADGYGKNADPQLQTSLWTKLAGVAAIMSRSSRELSPEALSLCREVLLRAAVHEDPIPDPDMKFDFPSWSPAPRIEAAQGLPWLSLKTADEPVLNAISALTEDPVPSVRFLIAGELFRLRWTAPETFWPIVTRRAEREDNRSALTGLLAT